MRDTEEGDGVGWWIERIGGGGGIVRKGRMRMVLTTDVGGEVNRLHMAGKVRGGGGVDVIWCLNALFVVIYILLHISLVNLSILS